MAGLSLAVLLAVLLTWATAPMAMAALTLYSCPERTAQKPGADSSSGSSSTSKRGLEVRPVRLLSQTRPGPLSLAVQYAFIPIRPGGCLARGEWRPLEHAAATVHNAGRI